MATIRKLPNGKSRVDWKDVTRKSQSRTFNTDAEAKKFRNMLDAHRQPPAAQARRTIEDWGSEWLAQLARSRATYTAYEQKFRLYILPTLGHRKVNQIDRRLVQAFIEEMRRAGCTEPTVRYSITVLKMLLQYVMDHGAIQVNSARRMSLPTPLTTEKRFLGREEVEKIAAAATSDRDRLMVFMGAFAGLRISEILALRVKDFDVDRQRVTVSGSMERGGFGRKDTKNHRVRSPHYPSWVGTELRPFLADRDPEEPAFKNKFGQVLRYDSWYRVCWLPLTKETGNVGLRFHDLRHSYVAMLIQAGAPPVAIKEAVGHGSITITMDVYGHLFDGMIGGYVEKI